MAYQITARCVACGDCLPVCPNEAIFAGMLRYWIESDCCEECSTCAERCAEKAIQRLDPTAPATYRSRE